MLRTGLKGGMDGPPSLVIQDPISSSLCFAKSVSLPKVFSASSGKTYYIKVRAYKTVNGKKYYGNWSTVKKVKVK